MASICLINGKWRALVRRKGHAPKSQSFATKTEAAKWARALEADIDAERIVVPDRALLRDLIARYIKEQEQVRKLGRSKFFALRQIGESNLGGETLASLTVERLRRFARERGAGPVTVAADMSYIGVVLKHARAVWGLKVQDNTPDARHALYSVGLVGKGQERDRRPADDELARLKAHFAKHSELPMGDLMDFAVATSMRASEITGLRWADLDEERATILVRDRKHPSKKLGNHQRVPLLKNAMAIIQAQPRNGELIFPYNAKTFSSIFPRACRRVGVVDLKFHDLRHEAITRLFEKGYQIQEVALWSGHRSWAQLKRYTNLRAETIRRLD